jgi:uncharacterized protein
MPTIDDARHWYDSDDPVHGIDHVIRVFHLVGYLALLEGADLEIVQAAALLHDAGINISRGERSDHHRDSAQFAKQVLENESWTEKKISAVQHCIQAHRFRDQSVKPKTVEAMVLFDADKLDAIGAIGVIRSVAYAILANQNIFVEPSSKFIATGQREPGEPHTPYHEYLFKLQNLKNMMYTRSGRELAEGRHVFIKSFFSQLISELRMEK